MAITFDGQNDKITTTSQNLVLPSNVAGNTNNMFYKRSVEIVRTKKDPLAKVLGDEK